MELPIPGIEQGKKIWEIVKIISEFRDAFEEQSEQAKLARVLLVLLRRMAANENVDFDLKEFKVLLPHANRNWTVRYNDPHADSVFIIDFKPDPALMGPKRIIVNLGLVKQFPEWGMIVIFGRDADEIAGAPAAKAIIDWMAKQEDELTMAYGRRERERIGR